MESLPKELLFMILQNLHPWKLIHLSRVNRRWYEVALHPTMHRCIDFQGKQNLSSALICNYISKFGHSLEKLNLQECYWLKDGPLSRALQKCRKLTSLNVIGCDVTKKTICSVLKLNSSLRTLEWSISGSDLHLGKFPPAERSREVLVSFCNELANHLSGLDCLAIRLPVSTRMPNWKLIAPTLIIFGMPVICSGLYLKRFTLQWLESSINGIECIEIVLEGSDIHFQKSDFVPGLYGGSKFYEMSLNAVDSVLEDGTLHTFVVPGNEYFLNVCNPPKWDHHLKKLEAKTAVVNMDLGGLVNMDLGGLRLQDSRFLMAILSAQSLRYLNLTGLDIDGCLLQVIATSSPNLEALNLHDCRGCLKPLRGLESLAECCKNLAQLNLKGVHHQESEERPNGLMEIISKFTNLVSLSLCTCGLGPASESKKDIQGSNDFQRSLFKSNKRVCHGASSSSCDGAGAMQEGAASKDSTPWNELNSELALDCMVKACNKLTEFELIASSTPGISFVKSYFIPPPSTVRPRLVNCPSVNTYCTYDTLTAVMNWTSLQRLMLAVPMMKGSLQFLVAVTRNCPSLQFLSLATMSGLNHSGNVVLLQEALSYCHQLRDFRLEQPNFNITESFLLTLGQLKHLERLCIIANSGTMKMYSTVVISLFEKCRKLYYFQVLCDITIKASKDLMKAVTSRFAETRPGLIVSVVNFDGDRSPSVSSLTVEVNMCVPVVHFKEMFLFGTTVATRVPNYFE